MSQPDEPTLSVRDLCRERYPWPLISDLVEGEAVAACYIVHGAEVRRTRQDKPFLKLTLGDASGQIDAMVWDDALRVQPLCAADAVIGVRARVGSYRDRPQLSIDSVHRIQVEDEDYARLLPTASRPIQEMERGLDRVIGEVQDAGLRALLASLLGPRGTLRSTYRRHPAAKANHHAYIGGLLEHSVSLAALCKRMAEHYIDEGYAVDLDLLLAGALLHDVGKLRELSASGSFRYTDPGQLLGHIVMGVQMVQSAGEAIDALPEDRLTLLLHLIASHQGRLEWASPVVPRTLEAIILHAADNVDATVNKAGRMLEAADPGGWSAYDRSSDRAYFRPPAEDPAESPPHDRGTDRDDAFDLFG